MLFLTCDTGVCTLGLEVSRKSSKISIPWIYFETVGNQVKRAVPSWFILNTYLNFSARSQIHTLSPSTSVFSGPTPPLFRVEVINGWSLDRTRTGQSNGIHYVQYIDLIMTSEEITSLNWNSWDQYKSFELSSFWIIQCEYKCCQQSTPEHTARISSRCSRKSSK
jgi:hypothetical protein